MMRVSEKGIALIKEFEQCRLTAYECPKSLELPAAKKFWTIGWGNTFYADGKPVKKGDKVTQAQADNLFHLVLAQFERDADSLVKSKVTQGQFDSLVSFAYNCGSDIDADTKAEGLGDSTLLKKVNANPNDPTIAQEFMKWISKGTKFEKGLRRRRAKEAALYISK